jgi:hypothetical protein
VKKTLILFLVLVFLSIQNSYALKETPKNPKAGQFCAKKDLGNKIQGLKCKYDGSRNRWTVSK